MNPDDQFPSLLYDELRALAAHYLKLERRNHTLQPTALAHEAWLRMRGEDGSDGTHRRHFLATASRAIRQALVDHARHRNALKSGGTWTRVPMADGLLLSTDGDIDLLALDDALRELAKLNRRQARIVELRLFAGLDVEETAEELGVSRRTVLGDWSMARSWLHRALGDDTR